MSVVATPLEPHIVDVYSIHLMQGENDVTFKSNRENAELAQSAANSATLENVRIREQRSADAYAALATREERIATKAVPPMLPSSPADAPDEQ
ncbi:hypothetical protein [Sphingomonas sp. CARO-RG-8B-R24-01]|uniref:hypothetical protein n=1 Tax=Sphingomonas sp. CARO-RG-8B-R24-01 TaxID=2914831 RepID=UPI001F565F1E|nr:hypothetical protein [Sphingomonas sp. CARO-RG-8B-R24-01]